MRILFITEQPPLPLDTGGNVRTYHLLRGLASSHDVDLIATTTPSVQESYRRELSEFCRDVKLIEIRKRHVGQEGMALVASQFKRIPFVLSRHTYAAVRHEIANLFAFGGTQSRDARRKRGPFDVVHFNHLDAALYGTDIPAEIPRVVDQHNIVANQLRTSAESEGSAMRRLVLRREYRKTRRIEPELCNRMTRCLVCSTADATSLRAMGVTKPIAVIPNGVDLEYFSFSPENSAVASEVVFVGTLDYVPCERAVWFFCKEILPVVHRELPELRFVAVGRNPSPRLRDLAAENPQIQFTGRVDDVRPYVRRAKAFVVPLLSGSGTRLKILEAFALGTPVVTTTIGAEGIEAKSGRDMLVADDPKSFARGVVEIVRNPNLGQALRGSARAVVEELYGWKAICERLLGEYSLLAI